MQLPTPRHVSRRPRAVVSGSFSRHLREVRLAVEELFDEGAIVLSPRQVTAYQEISGGFLLLEGDRSAVLQSSNPILALENQHLAAIGQSDFLWVVCPNGYIGNSTALEIGYAVGARIPIYSLISPRIKRIAAYVTVVPSVCLAVRNHQVETLRA